MQKLLIKFSGELLSNSSPNKEFIQNIATQIKELQRNYKIGIVLGGGNIFRGNQHGKDLGLKSTTSHSAGMLATMINGLIWSDIFTQNDISNVLFSALECPSIACIIKQASINKALIQNECLIFVGGTGNPFFTTDTNAVLRAMQIGANQVWKATKVAGIFDKDPIKNQNPILFPKITYKEYLEKNLKVMDLTAITLAQQNNLQIKVFDIFTQNALIRANSDNNFGSTISEKG